MSSLTDFEVWQQLKKHYHKISRYKVSDLFEQNPKRWQQFSLSAAGLFLDYSKNLIDAKTLHLLCKLAEGSKLKNRIDEMFNGKPINNTENRPVLHTALRAPYRKSHLKVAGVDITALVNSSLQKMQNCSESISKGTWFGENAAQISDIVHIGIGGSDLGPAMVTQALKPYYIKSDMRFHFVSNVDGTHIHETLKNLDHERTLFIIASKSFTTAETLCNSLSAKEWFLSKSIADKNKDDIKRHFLAVTAKPERAIEFGIALENIYPFWDWVGGRFSLWSTIGLIIAIAVGMDNFRALLHGAEMMDKHFLQAPWQKNMPVLMALLGIWYINFFNAKTQAILPYDQYLKLFPNYVQQIDMESNGKSIDRDGNPVDHATAPIVWGSVGTNGQHAFHQLFMQGTQMVPIDFILALQSHNPIGDHQQFLVANCFAQAQALMQGKSKEKIIKELREEGFSKIDAKRLAPHKAINGNNPNNMILMPKLTPETLGSLLALYEHKVFVQGMIWNINSFDQWGVELGKKLANKILPFLQNKKENGDKIDPSTQNLIAIYRKSGGNIKS